jgi:hypothetical protein
MGKKPTGIHGISAAMDGRIWFYENRYGESKGSKIF